MCLEFAVPSSALIADDDLRRLRKNSSATEVLFEVEPPNLFRDSSVDLRLAAKVVEALCGDCDDLIGMIRQQTTHAEGALREMRAGEAEGGLIDGRYDAMRRIMRRVEIWRSVS